MHHRFKASLHISKFPRAAAQRADEHRRPPVSAVVLSALAMLLTLGILLATIAIGAMVALVLAAAGSAVAAGFLARSMLVHPHKRTARPEPSTLSSDRKTVPGRTYRLGAPPDDGDQP